MKRAWTAAAALVLGSACLPGAVTHYQTVIEGILERDIGVAKYFSYIVIKSPIVKLHYPLAKLFGPSGLG